MGQVLHGSARTTAAKQLRERIDRFDFDGARQSVARIKRSLAEWENAETDKK